MCVSACIHTNIYAYSWIYIFIHLHTIYLYICMSVCTCVCACMYTRTYTYYHIWYKYMYIYIYVYAYTYILDALSFVCICIYKLMYMYTYIHIYVWTYRHYEYMATNTRKDIFIFSNTQYTPPCHVKSQLSRMIVLSGLVGKYLDGQLPKHDDAVHLALALKHLGVWVNESWRAHVWISHVTQTKVLYRSGKCSMSRIWMSHTPCACNPALRCHTFGRVMSHCSNHERTCHARKPVMSRTWHKSQQSSYIMQRAVALHCIMSVGGRCVCEWVPTYACENVSYRVA